MNPFEGRPSFVERGEPDVAVYGLCEWCGSPRHWVLTWNAEERVAEYGLGCPNEAEHGARFVVEAGEETP